MIPDSHWDGPRPTLTASVREALSRVVDPCSIATGVPINLLDMGLVLSADSDADVVTVRLQLTAPFCLQIGIITDKIRTNLLALENVTDVVVEVDHNAEWLPSMVHPSARAKLAARRSFPITPIERTPTSGTA